MTKGIIVIIIVKRIHFGIPFCPFNINHIFFYYRLVWIQFRFQFNKLNKRLKWLFVSFSCIRSSIGLEKWMEIHYLDTIEKNTKNPDMCNWNLWNEKATKNDWLQNKWILSFGTDLSISLFICAKHSIQIIEKNEKYRK